MPLDSPNEVCVILRPGDTLKVYLRDTVFTVADVVQENEAVDEPWIVLHVPEMRSNGDGPGRQYLGVRPDAD